MLKSARRPWWPESVVLLVISLMAAWVVNVGRPEPLPLRGDYAVKKVQETVAKGLPVMTPAEAVAALAAGGRQFVDARDPDEFAAGHVPGAVNIPAETLLTGLDAAVADLPKDKPYVVYCGNLSCPKSRELAEAMKAMGYTALTVLPEGFEGWKAAGGPVEGQ